MGHKLPVRVPGLRSQARRHHQRPHPGSHHPRSPGRHRGGHRQELSADGERGDPLARHSADRHAVGGRHGGRHAVPDPPRRHLRVQVRRRPPRHLHVPRALRHAALGGAQRHDRRLRASRRRSRRGRAVRLRRRARRAPQRLVAQEHVRAGHGAGLGAARVGRGAAGAADQRARQVRELHGAWGVLQLDAPAVLHARVRRGARQDVPVQDRQHDLPLRPQLRNRGPSNDGGGDGRALREAVRGEEPQHLFRRDLFRADHRRPGPEPQLLAGLERGQPQARHAHRHRRPRLLRRPQQPSRPAVHGAPIRPGVERHHVPHEPEPRHRGAPGLRVHPTTGPRPDHHASEHAEQDRRPDQVGAQQRLLLAASHPLPCRPQGQAPWRLRPAPAAGDVQPHGVRRVRRAAEPERDEQRRAIPPGVRVRGGRGAAERQHAGGQQQRDAPMAPPRARLLGARVRRGAVRPGGAPGDVQPEGSNLEEHGGGAPLRLDGAAVEGGQPRSVGVPLPHRGALLHGHGCRLRGGDRTRREAATGDHGMRQQQGRTSLIGLHRATRLERNPLPAGARLFSRFVFLCCFQVINLLSTNAILNSNSFLALRCKNIHI